MGIATNLGEQYQAGGSLAQNAPYYLVRQADQEFYQALKAGEFCYIFGSPGTGKSSLRLQTIKRLEADQIACSVINLASIGSDTVTPEQWYLGIVRMLGRSCQQEILSWWRDRQGISPLQRLDEFVETVVLAQPQPMIIWIDDADQIDKLSWQDDFWAWLWACYERRAENPQYQRLCFALLSMANSHPHRLFDVGKTIFLSNFELEQLKPLARGLEGKVDDPHIVIKEIFAWSGGQPFLTQKLCQIVSQSSRFVSAGKEAELVEELVRSQIIDNWQKPEGCAHLKWLRDRLLDSKYPVQLLLIYRQIWQYPGLSTDNHDKISELQRIGLITQQQEQLEVANPIYREVFNLEWIEQQLEFLGETERAFAQNQQVSSLVVTRKPGQTLPITTTSSYQHNLAPRSSLVEPLLKSTRVTRFSLTLLIVSLVAVTAAVVVAQNANQELQDATNQLTDLESTSKEKAQEIEQISQQTQKAEQARQEAQKQLKQIQQEQQKAEQARREAQRQLERLRRERRQQQRNNSQS